MQQVEQDNLRAALQRIKEAKGSSLYQDFQTLVLFRLDRAKSALVEAPPAEMARVQGEAQAYKKLLDELKRATFIQGDK
jgi:hypothetical protein